ncbi:MAG: AraC family transcriptional regulator ligand-binding domain-containing protein [Nannocystaceae bacterium]
MSGPSNRMAAELAIGTVLFALSRGVTMEEIRQATGISAELMDNDGWLPQEVVPRVWLLLARRAPGEAIALEMARMTPPGVLGRFASIESHVADLRTLLRLAVRNRGLFADGLTLNLVETDDEASLRWSHVMDDADGGHAAELGAGVIVRALREAYGPAEPFSRVEFAHRPHGPLETYHDFFRVPVRFGCSCYALHFAPGALDRPNPRAAPELHLFVQRHLAHLRRTLGARSDSDSLERVRAAVAHNAVRGEFTGEALARSLGTSPRSLQRLLQAEGTSARALLDEARIAHAHELLRDPALSIDEIADLLGYATERSFRRAFERATGRSPARTRRAG